MQRRGGDAIECRPCSVSFAPGGEQSRRVAGPEGALAFSVQLPPAVLSSELYARLAPSSSYFEPLGRPSLSAAGLFRAIERRDAAVCDVEEAILELLADVAGVGSGVRQAESRVWLARVERMLRDRFDEPLTLRSLADSFGVHPAYLATVFRQSYGCTIGAYLRRLRIEAALQALCTTDRSIAAIAQDAGFYDQSHFIRTFQSFIGAPPGDFRRMLSDTRSAD